ncbi:MAG TPA: hypothetical protein PKE06_02230 [Flavilitoribacter sp.]|nr:hypothetical protein [Flavilitoribacter sp.]HMQ86429.1 hypothetical protein [Flavilitoribacter sp.]
MAGNKIRKIAVSLAMKCLTSILSFYFLMLSLLPCTDTCASENEMQDGRHRMVSGEHSGCSHQQDDDLCSPFCTCTCCGQVTAGFKTPGFHPGRFFLFADAPFTYQRPLQREFPDGIFRPPKVVIA